jgi:hypothetical protein
VITPDQFRASVDARLRGEAALQGRSLNRVRTLLVMERFLVRMVAVAPDAFLLKGGLALELRLAHSRTTGDIDVLARRLAEDAEELVRRAAGHAPDPPDHLEFAVEPNARSPEIDGVGVRYQGRRFRVRPTIGSRPFGDPFGVDVAVADAVSGPPEVLEGSEFFARYGIGRLRVPVYPVPTHLAEKVHALTLPRSQVNTRLKDLVDVALLSELDGHDARSLRMALEQTFTFRASHPVPDALPDAPEVWSEAYTRLQAADGLPWPTLVDVLEVARAFLDPVLTGVTGRWTAATQSWKD